MKKRKKIRRYYNSKKTKQRKRKYKFKPPFYILMILLIVLAIYILTDLKNNVFFKINYVKEVTVTNNEFKILLKKNSDYSCILTFDDKTPELDDKNWVKSEDNICTIKYNKDYNKLYIKNNEKIIYKNYYLSYFKLNKTKLYLPYNTEYNLPITYIGNENNIKVTTDDEYVTLNNLKVKAIKSGTSTIKIKALKKEYTIEVITSKYYVDTTKLTGKKAVTCNQVSKEENDLLDKILKGKIEEVGYKTRAGVVEAARFLTLHFPYKIEYFYENGRLVTNGVDGEGRYYHKGLYLNSSRYSSISKSKNGPKAWGCSLYSTPVKRKDSNGLDCSGFVSWALLNGGFNSGDLGAGFTSAKNLTNLGNLKKVTSSLIKSNKIKAGDLVHNYEATGHIGIIIGVDKDNYYVAQAIWYDDNGVTVTKVSKSYMPTKFPHVVLMDDYYKSDGKYTKMW